MCVCLAQALVNTMLAIKQPYSVSTAAEAGGLAALAHADDIMGTVALLRAAKDALLVSLAQVRQAEPGDALARAHGGSF